MNGRLDIHCHLLPGIDDGCVTADESIVCIRALIERGYTGSICTPHIWPELFPDNTPEHIAQWTADLGQRLSDTGIDYTLYPGGELRLFDGAIDWMKTHGIPTLAGSSFVLVDCWEPTFPRHGWETLDWLLAQGITPILAHPERAGLGDDPETMIASLTERGVLFQGNFNPLSGTDVPGSQARARQLMARGLYSFLAMDMHRPDSLGSRLAGLDDAIQRFGTDAVDRLTRDNPHRLLPPEAPAPPGNPRNPRNPRKLPLRDRKFL